MPHFDYATRKGVREQHTPRKQNPDTVKPDWKVRPTSCSTCDNGGVGYVYNYRGRPYCTDCMASIITQEVLLEVFNA
jgi:hypothetical protein